MIAIRYHNFDLAIEPVAADQSIYRARVLDSPAGQARAEFVLPLSDVELENYVLKMARPRRGVRSLHSSEGQAAQELGRRLYDAVFHGEILACLLRSLDHAEEQNRGLRIRLRLTDAPELADVPWEYLYDTALGRFFGHSEWTPIVRFLDLSRRVRPLSVQTPLRVLVMIASPDDYEPLDVAREWATVQRAVAPLEARGLIRVERLQDATLSALQQELRQDRYHVFHFIGHGGLDQRTGESVLLLAGDDGKSRLVHGAYLSALLHDHRSLRLCLLNACEGARASRTDPFAGVAQHLVRGGIPAVIAMQFEITDPAAITLAREFYASLADGYGVDTALAAARKSIFVHGNDVEWGTPVLYMRANDGQLFEVAQTANPPTTDSAANGADEEAGGALGTEDAARFARLRTVLADLYPDEASARRVADDAGLPVGGISFSPHAINNWHAVLGEAAKTNRIDALLAVVLHEYGGNQALVAAAAAFGVSTPGDEEDEQRTADESPGRSATVRTEEPPPTGRQKSSGEQVETDGGVGAWMLLLRLAQETNDPDLLERLLRGDAAVHGPIPPEIQQQLADMLRQMRTAQPAPPQTPIAFDWVTIAAGEFTMGSDKQKDSDAYDDETPQHRLHLPEFCIARTPVTNMQYKQFVGATGYAAPQHWQNGQIPAGKQDHPVVYVSWRDAQEFCQWAGVRLPSEAEWEKAARGMDGRIYPWGNEPPDKTLCNFNRNVDDTTPVGDYPDGASPYGVLDMVGNVWEWTGSLWGSDASEPEFGYPYEPDDGRENLAAPDSIRRVVRGGSWDVIPDFVRAAVRLRGTSDGRDDGLGVRVVWSPGF